MTYSISWYRVMWVWVLFDLPVLSGEERKRATRFRNDLLNAGFSMVQYSVYIKRTPSREKAEALAGRVAKMIPEAGHVQILFFTDRQYAMSQIYYGKHGPQSMAEKMPQQLVLL